MTPVFLNPLTTNVADHLETTQFNWLVSICLGIMVVNGSNFQAACLLVHQKQLGGSRLAVNLKHAQMITLNKSWQLLMSPVWWLMTNIYLIN